MARLLDLLDGLYRKGLNRTLTNGSTAIISDTTAKILKLTKDVAQRSRKAEGIRKHSLGSIQN